MPSYVEDLRTHLGLDQLTIVAHTAGTRLTIAYAVQYPDRVAGMLLITPPANYLQPEAFRQAAASWRRP